MNKQTLPYSDKYPATAEPSTQYWKDLAEQRGLLLHDMMEKWAERRVEFVGAKRKMGQKIDELVVRERTMTHRIKSLERTLLILQTMLSDESQPLEAWRAMMAEKIQQVMPMLDTPPRGGYAGGQQE